MRAVRRLARRKTTSISATVMMALALLIPARVASAAPAPAVAPAPLGLDVEGSEYALLSNGASWQVSANGGGFRPVKVVAGYVEAQPGSTSAAGRQNWGFMWAPACTAAQQTLTFRRTYFLPGPARTLGVLLMDTTQGGGFANSAISSTKLYINGKLAVSVPGSRFDASEQVRPQAKFFRYGSNTIEIKVVKRAQQGTFGRCFNGTPVKPLGLLVSLKGDFEADLWLSNDQYKVEEIYQRAAPGATRQGFVFTASPQNRGASGVYHGVFTITVGGTISSFDPTPTAIGPLQNCTVGPYSLGGIQLKCDIVRMAPKTSARASFRAFVELREGVDEHVPLVAQVSSFTSDPDGDSNGWRRTRHICSATSTDPRCPPN